MADMDERVEKVIAEVIPDPEERAQVKAMIKSGFMTAEWDEETSSPRFTTTSKLAEKVRQDNMADRDTRAEEAQHADPYEPFDEAAAAPGMETLSEFLQQHGPMEVEIPPELAREIHSVTHLVAQAYGPARDVVQELMNHIDEGGKVDWVFTRSDRAAIVTVMATDLTIEAISDELLSKLRTLIEMQAEGDEQ